MGRWKETKVRDQHPIYPAHSTKVSLLSNPAVCEGPFKVLPPPNLDGLRTQKSNS